MKISLYKYGKAHPLTFRTSSYTENGNLAVSLVTHEEGYPEPWSNLTVNLSVKCGKGCAFIDTNNNGNEIIDWLINHGLGYLTGRTRVSGFCLYPEFKFNMCVLAKYAE